MKYSSLTLYLEISNTNFIFFAVEIDEKNNFKIVYKLELPIKGIKNNRITNLEEVNDVLKKNIYIIEQKLSHTFKEIVLVLEK